MVQEFRRILLNKEEVIYALEAHRRLAHSFLPEGKIVDFEVLGPTSIMVTVDSEAAGHEANVIFTDAKLLKALIRFCLENNIMLPREGRKSIAVEPDGIALCVELDVLAYLTSTMEPLHLEPIYASA